MPTPQEPTTRKAILVCTACHHREELEISNGKKNSELSCPACVRIGTLVEDVSDSPSAEPKPTQALQVADLIKEAAQAAASAATQLVAQQFAKKEADFQQLISAEGVPEDVKKELWQLKVQELKMRQQLQIADHFVKSGAFTKDVQNAGQALVKIQAGAEIGLSPAESMTGLALINGNVTPWGVTLTKQLRKHGWELEYGTCNAEEATVTIIKGEKKIPFTAKKAEVPNSKAIGFAAIDKLKWHAISRLCRFYVPEVLGGMQYIAEELEDGVDIQQVQPDTQASEKHAANAAEAQKLLDS